jgi:hypothetical protein
VLEKIYVFSLACKNKECIHLSKLTQSLTVCVLQKISTISLVNSKNIQYSVVISRVHAKYGKIFKARMACTRDISGTISRRKFPTTLTHCRNFTIVIIKKNFWMNYHQEIEFCTFNNYNNLLFKY